MLPCYLQIFSIYMLQYEMYIEEGETCALHLSPMMQIVSSSHSLDMSCFFGSGIPNQVLGKQPGHQVDKTWRSWERKTKLIVKSHNLTDYLALMDTRMLCFMGAVPFHSFSFKSSTIQTATSLNCFITAWVLNPNRAFTSFWALCFWTLHRNQVWYTMFWASKRGI